MSGYAMQRRTPIGVDLGSRRIKAVQLVRGRSGWRLGAALSMRRRSRSVVPEEAEFGLLADALFGGGFVGSSVIVGAPRAVLKSAMLDLPPRGSGAPIDEICRAEVSRMFRMAPGSYEMHAWEVPLASERAATTQLAVSALERDQAEALVEPFESQGIEVEAIDLAGAALGRACRGVCAGSEGLTAAVDIGWDGLGLVVVRAGECVYERWLRGHGVGCLSETVAVGLGVEERSAEVLLRRVGLRGMEGEGLDGVMQARLLSMVREFGERLLHEVLGSVAYVLDRFPGESVRSLRLAGGGAGIPDLGSYLAEIGGFDVHLAAPSVCGVACGQSQDDPSLVTALGHALWRAEV